MNKRNEKPIHFISEGLDYTMVYWSRVLIDHSLCDSGVLNYRCVAREGSLE